MWPASELRRMLQSARHQNSADHRWRHDHGDSCTGATLSERSEGATEPLLHTRHVYDRERRGEFAVARGDGVEDAVVLLQRSSHGVLLRDAAPDASADRVAGE